MVEGLVAKTTAWEREKGIPFTYDGVIKISFGVWRFAHCGSSYSSHEMHGAGSTSLYA